MSDPQSNLPHHQKHEYCDTRPKYRRGKKRTSVRVFTVNLESKFLLIIGVPAIGLEKDLLRLFSGYGSIQEYKELKGYDREDFTHVYLLKYEEIQAAKTAKKKLDEHYFFGAVLHVCYAPEYETLEDAREKIIHRRQSVTSRVKFLEKEAKEIKRKRGKKVKTRQSSSKNNPTPPTSGEKPSTSDKITASDEIGPSFVPIRPRIEINVPVHQMGIPLYLPPPPPPNAIFRPPVYPNYPPPHNPWNHPPNLGPNPNQFRRVESRDPKNNKKVDQRQNSNSFEPTDIPGPSASKKPKLDETKPKETTQNINFNRKPPKFKTKSGYFHQKVLDVLVQKRVLPTQIIPQVQPNTPRAKIPSFLPRKIELKQIEEMNKIELNEDGSVPLLGKFVSEQ